jgi:cell division protein FtsQ
MPKRPASDAPTRDDESPSRAAAPEELDATSGAGAEDAGGGYRRRTRPVRVRQRREAAIAARVVRGLRILWPLWAVLAVAWVIYQVATTSPAFVLNGSREIAVSGAPMVRRSAVRSIFAADVGRNIYFIPLAAREQALEKLPWVRRAAVLRIWPDHLRVQLRQRKPVAFARRGTHLMLIDAKGVLLPLPPRAQYQFPVLTGLKPGPGARADRQAQVAQFLAVESALAPAGVDARISEVNVADPADTVLSLPQRDGETIRLELGNQDYLARYRLFAAHIGTWRSEYPNLRSVNLRYPGQAILDSGQNGTARKRTR